MVPKIVDHRLVRNTSLLLLLLLLTTLLAGQPSHAASNSSSAVGLDNIQGDFANGVFQRTALGPQDLETDLGLNYAYEAGAIADEPGIAQLAPAGTLKPWNVFTPELPAAVTNAGVTAMGNYIYVIGGILSGSGALSDKVYWSKVDPYRGSLIGDTWNTDTVPATQMILDNDPIFTEYPDEDLYECPTKTISGARGNVGVASLDASSTTGYIYVIGGSFSATLCRPGLSLSTSVIQRATVNKTTGALTWTTLSTPLPSPEFPDNGTTATRFLGTESMATTIVPYRDGNTMRYFLYAMGGKSSFIMGNEYTPIPKLPSLMVLGAERAFASVYYTEIDPATGNFKHPVSGSTTDVWVRDSDNIQLYTQPIDNEGLFDAGISGTNIFASNGTDMKSMIFIAGGLLDLSTVNPKFNTYVYRADVGANGDLNWGSTNRQETVGARTVGIEGRRGMGVVASNNKLYFIAGSTNIDPGYGKDSVPTAIYDDNGDLIEITPGVFILGTDDKVLTSTGDSRRDHLGVAIVEATLGVDPNDANYTNKTPAWIYVIGGVDSSGATTNTIFRGEVGGDDSNTAIRARDGWYYSPVFQTSYVFDGGQKYIQARLLKFAWATHIDRSSNADADIEIYFRAKQTASGQCGPDTFTSGDAWNGPLDGYAGSGLHSQHVANGDVYNEYNLQANFSDTYLVGNCVQYRAKLIQGGTERSHTPRLLSVYVEREIVGTVNLIIPANGFSVNAQSGNVDALTINIQNLANNNPGRTLSFNQALEAIKGVGTGSFYVNLCIARSDLVEGDPVYPPLTLPNPNEVTFNPLVPANFRQICPYYADIQTVAMSSNTILDLMSTDSFTGRSYWHLNDGNTYPNVPDLIQSAFSRTGHYTIGLLLDTGNNIPEEDASTTQPAFGEGIDNQSTRFTPLINFTVRGGYSTFLPMLMR